MRTGVLAPQTPRTNPIMVSRYVSYLQLSRMILRIASSWKMGDVAAFLARSSYITTRTGSEDIGFSFLVVIYLMNLSNRSNLHDRYLTPTLPYTFQLQSCGLDECLELLRCPLNPVDDPHHAEIALVAVPRVIAKVGRERRWRCFQLRASCRSVHHMVADQKPRCG